MACFNAKHEQILLELEELLQKQREEHEMVLYSYEKRSK